MTNGQIIQHTFKGNICQLQVPLHVRNANKGVVDGGGGGGDECAANRRNCDIFVEDHNFYIYVDVRMFKFHLSRRQFDTKDMKNLIIKFNTKTNTYEVNLPCLPQTNEDLKSYVEKGELEEKHPSKDLDESVELWKLKRITEHCHLQVDNSAELEKFEADYAYGFARKFKGKILCESDLSAISRMPEPQLVSPLQRTIDREIDELKSFSRDQYKLNFVELQVPEGHDNPMKFTINFEDAKLTRDEECLLHNLIRKPEDFQLPDAFDQTEIDCGLVSILLAICYDIRSTSNEQTCESGWTRSILCPTFSYFEPFENLKDVVISFLRRSIIYPLYRNYDLGRLCVQDAVDALHRNSTWLLKQLIATHLLFASSDSSREVFNRYYLNDYIRYVANSSHCSTTNLQTLARNLKNVHLDVCKKHLRLDLAEIETELLKELITDIHIGNTSTSEDDTEDDDYDAAGDDNEDAESSESDGDKTDSSSDSDTEENSVIEQCKEVVNHST